MKSLLKNRGLKNISYLTFGSAISQIISLIGAFYIPRILGPNDYGIYQTVLAYVGMFTIFTFSGMNKVVLRECSRNLEDAKEIFEKTIGLRNLCSVLASLIPIGVVIFIDYDVGTKLFIAIYSISLLMSGLRSSFTVIYQANERMQYVAILTIARTIMSVSLSILSVSLGYGVLSLILINVFAGITVLTINYRFTKRFLEFDILSKLRFKKLFIKQGITFSLIGFLNMLSGKIDFVMISILGTPAQVGTYALAYNLVAKGLIVRQAVSQSIFPIYTKQFSNGKLRTETLFKHTFLLSFPALGIAFLAPLFSEQLITLVVGHKFIDSIPVFNVLLFYLVFSYMVVPFGLSLQTGDNENCILVIVSIKAILNIGCNIFLYYSFGIIGIAYSTLINESVSTFSQIGCGYVKLRNENK